MDRQKEGKPIVPSGVNTGRGLIINTLCIYQGYSKYSKISNISLIQKRYRQTEQTQIRLPLKKQSDQDLPVCFSEMHFVNSKSEKQHFI